jgi:4-amino-4-deoxy-L-arabinose transferase-like glycosyltransferase
VTLWPGSKPYVGGSTDGSIWNLIFGYNGFGRIFGEGGGMGGGGGPTFGGSAGLLRMFNAQVGGQIAWLLPLAGVSLVLGLWTTRRAARTDLRRAGLVLFGVWALVHVLVFSTQKGIFHPYYVSALAPAVAALAGMGVVNLWHAARTSWAGAALLAATIAGTAWLAVDLLNRTADFAPWLRVAIPVAAGVAVLGTLALRRGAPRAALMAVAVSGAFALFAGPASYAVANVGHALNGNNVLAGPSGVGGGGFGGGPGGGGRGGFGGGQPPSGAQSGFGDGTPPGANANGGGPPSGGGGGGFGGRASISSSEIAFLEQNQGTAKYLVAATGSQTTAPIIIQTGKAVVTIGGFNGQDNSPTVAQLETMVKQGELKYVVASGNGALDAWVQQHGTAVSGYDNLYKVTT